MCYMFGDTLCMNNTENTNKQNIRHSHAATLKSTFAITANFKDKKITRKGKQGLS